MSHGDSHPLEGVCIKDTPGWVLTQGVYTPRGVWIISLLGLI